MLLKDFLQSDLYYQLKFFHLGIQLDGQFCFVLFIRAKTSLGWY